MKKTYSVFDVANWFLSKEEMTPKKLQKLVYYAYSWFLTLNNDSLDNLENKLFSDEEIQAWVHGPVCPSLYKKYVEYGYNEIPKVDKHTIEVFEKEVDSTLEEVWLVYGNFDGNELESITHQEKPWKKARNGFGPLDNCTEIISDKDIYSCYIQRVG
ncbi:Panacea domain-containing protein [Isobaculum melis]|uniref:Uncharacterized phage-associated protein n=1 Tax=Isobaculum melis TaxID=142588 RepID=A0A1H9TIR5_9LACT|nr:type II toxin-antitoxin system antitoxin SocA domain-containing protein [Isobaculum melis]SER96513.1 Uncharacterized phage-associated protein [Isobaculum melis]